jgi:predicted NBD/HSP70 family sugar kinase
MSTRRTTIRDVSRSNRSRVLRELYFRGPSNRPRLTRDTGLSAATVATIVSELSAEGVVLEAGLDEPEVGRPSAILKVNPGYGSFIGVDLGETQVQVELFDLTLAKSAAAVQPLSPENEPSTVVELVVRGVRQVQEAAGVADEEVLGIGVGVPGVVERAAEVSVHIASWEWQQAPLTAMLTEHLAIPIFMDNGANAMAQAEMWFGAGRGYHNLAVLLIGTGVGAGIFADGNPYRGTTNSAGEWGHTTIERGGRRCRCGRGGCLEAYVGAPAIIQRWQEAAPGSQLVKRDQDMQTIVALLEAAKAGDEAATAVITETAELLGEGIANLLNLFNPELVVLGGWVGVRLGGYMLPTIKRVVEAEALPPSLRASRIALGQLQDDAVAMGAATLALEVFLADAGWLRAPRTDGGRRGVAVSRPASPAPNETGP